jgi:hypothetical protein
MRRTAGDRFEQQASNARKRTDVNGDSERHEAVGDCVESEQKDERDHRQIRPQQHRHSVERGENRPKHQPAPVRGKRFKHAASF